MRTIYIPLLVIAVIVSSCHGKFTIAKRKYNKGFYVSASKAAKKPAEKTTVVFNDKKVTQSTTTEKVSAESAIAKNNSAEVLFDNNNIDQIITFSPKKDNRVSRKHSSGFLTASKDKVNSFVQKQFKEIEITPKKTDSAPKGKSSNSDVKLILCVIIALFIPPLGMFLWKQEADIWFIVDLILFLFLFSWFYWGHLGLLGLTAIIIALFRIFDLI